MSGFLPEIISSPIFIVVAVILVLGITITGLIFLQLWYKDYISGTIAIVSFIGSIVLIISVISIVLLIFNYFSRRNFAKRLSDDTQVERMYSALGRQLEDENEYNLDRSLKKSNEDLEENLRDAIRRQEDISRKIIKENIIAEMKINPVWKSYSDNEIESDINSLKLIDVFMSRGGMTAVRDEIIKESERRLKHIKIISEELEKKRKQQEDIERILEQYLPK